MSATVTRSLFTRDPSPVIEELRTLAGDDVQLLAQVAGLCVGYYRDELCAPLCDLMEAEIEGASAWVQLGLERRSAAPHGAPRRAVDRPGEAGRA
ncbi:hypothetical protein [Microbacterium sp. Bi128]|uniref:hypothetical protein n=1 Tax=Microbacterium sp. Bi128 TaxID=2821115 RepID=UPI001D787F78|nr:hypothetical protein [Microbacterium sp. Bi128]CAH0172791.1 hypothetical protein SRABI128_01075 [Microbacterium sp. Bi128]